MMLSHHPSCQYGRTYKFFHLRLCTRCTGIFLGVICSILLTQLLSIEIWCIFVIGLIFPIPAILNFTLNELGKIKNTNFKRLVTGALLGYSIGLSLHNLLFRNTLCGLIILLWIFLLEIIVAFILFRKDILDSFFKQYEDEVYKK